MTDLIWQPIETVPKDGTPVLVLCGRFVSTYRVALQPEKIIRQKTGIWPFIKIVEDVIPDQLIFEQLTDGGEVTYVAYSRLGLPPTHWMPIPPLEEKKVD